MASTESDEFVSRFDGQSTRWSMIQRAHGHREGDSEAARHYLVMRYAPAIRSYVRAMTRSEVHADDIAHDIIVRILQGDFSGADPRKGRFRDFLKTVVKNMTRNAWAKQKVRKCVDLDASQLELLPEKQDEVVWDQGWQKHVLSLAWGRLQQYELSHEGSIAYTVLKLRTDFPDDTSEQLAQRLSQKLGRPMRGDQSRQQLHRARVRYAEFLVEEIADMLDTPSLENIEIELSDVGLLGYVRDILPAK